MVLILVDVISKESIMIKGWSFATTPQQLVILFFGESCSILVSSVSFSSVLVYERFVQFNLGVVAHEPYGYRRESWIDGSYLGSHRL